MAMANKEYILNAKVDEYGYKLVARICKKKGFTVNTMMKMVCEGFVRYMSDSHNLTPELEEMMSLFEHLEGWKDSINLINPNAEREIAGAIYFLQEKDKKGLRPAWVEKPYFGQWTQDVNIVQILEKFLCFACPDLYKRLRSLGSELDTNTCFETIFTLCAMYGNDAYDKAFRDDFEDANRSEFGLKPHEGAPFRRHHHKDVDSQKGLDFEPFGAEW